MMEKIVEAKKLKNDVKVSWKRKKKEMMLKESWRNYLQ